MSDNAQSYTELDDYGHCPKLYELRHVWSLQRKKKHKNLKMGSAIHRILQATNLRPDIPSFEAADLEWSLMMDEVDAQEDLFAEEKTEEQDMLEDAIRIVNGYLDWSAEDREGEEILHVEERFVAVLDTGKVISCTPDVVVRRRDGAVVVRDYKSTVSTPSYVTPTANLQIVMNFAAVQSLYPETISFQFDRLRKKVPTVPRLNKTGARKVNNLNAVDTTYEMLRDFLRTDAPDLLDDPEHRIRLAELRDENRFYYREELFVSAEQVANGLDDVATRGRLLDVSMDQGLWPRTYHANGMRSCDSCEMRSLCQGQLLGWDLDRIIAEDYEDRDLSYKQYETEES